MSRPINPTVVVNDRFEFCKFEDLPCVLVFDNCGYVRNYTVYDLLGGGTLACDTGEKLKANLIAAARRNYQLSSVEDLGLETWTLVAGRIDSDCQEDVKYCDSFPSFKMALTTAIKEHYINYAFCYIECDGVRFTYDRVHARFTQDKRDLAL